MLNSLAASQIRFTHRGSSLCLDPAIVQAALVNTAHTLQNKNSELASLPSMPSLPALLPPLVIRRLSQVIIVKFVFYIS